jgi:hypothetical protein
MKESGGRKAVENFFNLLKTNIEKMSIFRLSAILMKTNELNHFLRDVAERKGDGLGKF